MQWLGKSITPVNGDVHCWYQILGISQTASAEEINQAWIDQTFAWHPDICPHPDAALQSETIRTIYDVLSNPLRRAEYDASQMPTIEIEPVSTFQSEANSTTILDDQLSPFLKNWGPRLTIWLRLSVTSLCTTALLQMLDFLKFSMSQVLFNTEYKRFDFALSLSIFAVILWLVVETRIFTQGSVWIKVVAIQVGIIGLIPLSAMAIIYALIFLATQKKPRLLKVHDLTHQIRKKLF